jgi:hypothetical protein
VLQLALE